MSSQPIQIRGRRITIGLLMLGLTLLPLGCSGTQQTQSETSTQSERTRLISEADALADFDAAWQIVYDTHYDTEFNGVDWVAVRDELRPAAANAHTRGELRAIMMDMLNRLGQSHFGIIPGAAADPAPERHATNHDHDAIPTDDEPGEMGEDGYREIDVVVPQDNRDGEGDADTGIDLRIIEGHAVVSSVRENSPAQHAGVKTGWILSKIRDREVDGILAQLREALSEEEMGIHAVSLLSGQLQGPDQSTARLTFLDEADHEVELSIEREPMPGEFVKFGNLPPMSTHLDWKRESFVNNDGERVEIGIIKFNIWMIPIAPKFERAMYELRDCDGLIIDLRGNPGGVGALSAAIGRFLVDEKASLGTMTMRGAELSFNIDPVIVTTWGEEIDPFAGPIAILQDSGSASTSEVFAGGLQSLGRVEVIGTRSAGMALPASMDKLPSGDVLLHAIADFVSSTGARMEDGGVVPDIEVKLSREDLLKGIDTPETVAKQWISEQIDAK
ncbi:MAG: hypothetical protein CMJ25_29750 [Phycisphaerae bacterium]|nr:hypothetical protein [Phycisphaerae bacterium]